MSRTYVYLLNVQARPVGPVALLCYSSVPSKSATFLFRTLFYFKREHGLFRWHDNTLGCLRHNHMRSILDYDAYQENKNLHNPGHNTV